MAYRHLVFAIKRPFDFTARPTGSETNR